MSALPARKLDSESDGDQASLRTRQALRLVGAKQLKREKKEKSGSGNVVVLDDYRAKKAATEAPDRPVPPKPLLLKPKPPPAGRPGPQRISPLGSVLQLRADQSRARFDADEGGPRPTTSIQDVPIETGHVFLEPNVRSYTLPEESESERWAKEQERELETRRRLIVSEQPSAAPGSETETEAEPTEAASEPTEAESWQPDQNELRTRVQQMRAHAALRAGQFEDKKREEEAEMTVTAKVAQAKEAFEKVREMYEELRLGFQAVTAESIVTFFTLLLDANVKLIKQFVASKVDIPFLYRKTSKPNIPFTMIVGTLDLLLFGVMLVGLAVPITIIVIVVMVAVEFDIFSIIYDFFSGLF